MTTFYAYEDGAVGEYWLEDQVVVAGEVMYSIRAKEEQPVRRRRKEATRNFSAKPAKRLWRDLGDYLATGVTPWVCRKVFDLFREHDVRMDVLSCAWVVQTENPTWTPKRVLCRAVREWQLLRNPGKIGFSGHGGRSADRRIVPVDADSAAGAVCAAVLGTQEAYVLAEEGERDARIAALAMVLLGELGKALESGLTLEQAADACGMHLATAYRKIDRVREMLAA